MAKQEPGKPSAPPSGKKKRGFEIDVDSDTIRTAKSAFKKAFRKKKGKREM